ncbi:MAG: 50S ribosomal protein L17 [Actinobacteria bacterium]|nr:50S ribosomal protein L17 [Actinomycetota bacterium]
MVVPKKGGRFGGTASHQKAIMRNLAISLFENGRIVTTLPKARHLRGFVDRLIVIAKEDTLAARRNCIRMLHNTNTVRKLFNEVAPATYQRSSGFTRVVKFKTRPGDGADLVIMELIK